MTQVQMPVLLVVSTSPNIQVNEITTRDESCPVDQRNFVDKDILPIVWNTTRDWVEKKKMRDARYPVDKIDFVYKNIGN